MKLIKISAIWCPSCLIMEKVWQQLQDKLQDITFISYDYDLDSEVELYNIGKILPVIILEKNGRELTRFVGEKTKDQIIEGLKKYEK